MRYENGFLSTERAELPTIHPLAAQLIHLWVLPGQFVAAMLPDLFFLLVAAC